MRNSKICRLLTNMTGFAVFTSKRIASMEPNANLSMKDHLARQRRKRTPKKKPCPESQKTGTCRFDDKCKFSDQNGDAFPDKKPT